MKILILEDNEYRIAIFKVLFANHECHFFTDVAPAIEYIRTYEMNDIMLLDHDLGGEVYVPSSNKNTGWQFAKFLADNNYHCKQIIIHSQNTVGAQNMYNTLIGVADDLRAIPFPDLLEQL